VLISQETKAKAAQMVRLALFYEYGRKPIKRSDLRTKCAFILFLQAVNIGVARRVASYSKVLIRSEER